MARKYIPVISVLFLLIGIISMMACNTGSVTPEKISQYLGSEGCAQCHEGIYDVFIKSGHPYKLNKVENGVPPEYPFTEVPSPPEGYSWDDVAYVIGGYNWKARFIGHDGFIITGDENATTQYNFATNGWVGYHGGEEKPYDCGSCHTTGYSPEGHQNDMPGMIGTWAEDGVGCEGCHGPGAEHAQAPSAANINVNMPADNTCGNCHIRGDINVIDVSGGFVKHHEQYEEFIVSPHFGSLNCTSCHDPHAGVVHDSPAFPNGGLVANCEDCHPAEAANEKSLVMASAGVTCVSCHMPFTGKSATGNADIFQGDVRNHIWKINTDPNAHQFNAEGNAENPYVSLEWSCQQCHIDGGGASVMELADLAEFAEGYHDVVTADSFVGRERCKNCHSQQYNQHINNGHSFKLNRVTGGEAPTYPYSEVPSPPDGVAWSDVSYVIGGYYWKARFVGLDGYIITGDETATTQYNLATQGWVGYHAGEVKPYDCGTCHTTGYSPEGNQDGLEGLIGTWSEPGVQCEACHGPAGGHVQNPSTANINVGMDAEDACGNCHIRGDVNVIDAKGGFTKHHEQYEEMLQSPHNGILDCTTCHDPHVSILNPDPDRNGEPPIRMECTTCHASQASDYGVPAMLTAGISCENCHMAQVAKSAIGNIDLFTGDVHSHLWEINTDPGAEQFTNEGAESNPWINLQYACLQCHNPGGIGPTKTLGELATFAEGFH